MYKNITNQLYKLSVEFGKYTSQRYILFTFKINLTKKLLIRIIYHLFEFFSCVIRHVVVFDLLIQLD